MVTKGFCRTCGKEVSTDPEGRAYAHLPPNRYPEGCSGTRKQTKPVPLTDREKAIRFQESQEPRLLTPDGKGSYYSTLTESDIAATVIQMIQDASIMRQRQGHSKDQLMVVSLDRGLINRMRDFLTVQDIVSLEADHRIRIEVSTYPKEFKYPEEE